MVFLIKENGVKNILFHISILPSVEQKANAWNYRQYRILLAQKLIEPFTTKKRVSYNELTRYMLFEIVTCTFQGILIHNQLTIFSKNFGRGICFFAEFKDYSDLIVEIRINHFINEKFD